MTPKQAIIDGERIAREVIPDLAGREFYVVQPNAGSMMTRDILGDSAGYYHTHMDLALQPQLEREGRWRGRGVCIIVDAEAIFENSRCPSYAYRCVIGIVLHEVAHWVDDLPELEPTPSAIQRALEPVDYLSMERMESVRRIAGSDFPRELLAHGEGFTRACCHVYRRAKSRPGSQLEIWHLRFGSLYRGLEMLPAATTFLETLEGEIERCQGMKLRDVLALQAPTKFTRLWHRLYRRHSWNTVGMVRKSADAGLAIAASS